jgi:hypothetical protein
MLDCKGLGRMWMYPKGRTLPRNRSETDNNGKPQTTADIPAEIPNRHHPNTNVHTWRFTKRFGFTVCYIQFITVVFRVSQEERT